MTDAMPLTVRRLNPIWAGRQPDRIGQTHSKAPFVGIEITKSGGVVSKGEFQTTSDVDRLDSHQIVTGHAWPP